MEGRAVTCRMALALILGLGLLVGSALIAGGYNVSAAAGHLAPVEALLHFTMQNSVTVRAGARAPDDLDSDARAMAGAGQYDLVCRECHGAPGAALNAVARSLVPSPPHILEAIRGWEPDELFWIVRNGIKMTAMPAWPAPDRDDEVWSMVSFLLRLPDLEAEDYRGMVMGPLALGPVRTLGSELDAHLQRCARCHGFDGRGADAYALPRIDTLTRKYMENSLRAFAAGERSSGIMQAQASVVPPEYLDELAAHYAGAGEVGNPRLRPGSDEDPGRRLALEGAPERFVPPCAGCHGPAAHPRAEAYPVLAGQPVAYLETQLRLFRQGRRGGSPFAGIMRHVAQRLEERDIAAVARFYSELDPARVGPAVVSNR